MTPWVLVPALLLVLLGGGFAAADAALGTVSRAGVDELVRQRRYGARGLAVVVADRPRHVNLLLLLRLSCELSATVLVTVLMLGAVAPPWLAVLLAVLAMVLVSYVLVGVGPRTVGRQHPYRVGALVADPVRLLGRVLGPLSRLLIVLGNAITPGRGFREGPFASEVELREMLDQAGERGVVAADEAQMIKSVFDLGETIAREVMVPRTEVVWIEQHKTVRQALGLCLRSGFSRIPVIGDSVDEIVGVVHIKDLVRSGVGHDPRSAAPAGTVVDLMRTAMFVPDSKRLTELLTEMQTSRSHLAVAVDEYGGTAGLVTIEDILEEIVGEITDEYDTDDRPPVERVDDDTVRVSARLGVADLGQLFGTEIDPGEVDTVGGLLAQRLGRVPLPGTEAEVDGLRLQAEGGKDNRGRMRITTVLAHRTATAGDGHAARDQDRDGARGQATTTTPE